MIDEKRVLDTFLELVKIPCSTNEEREVADVLTKRLQELGGTVHEDDAGKKLGGTAGNLIADFPGDVDAPTILLTAHIDCVEPCANIRPVIRDGVIYSDGTTILGGDDKAGVAAILEALLQLREQKIPHGPIQVVFTVAEEGGVHGSQNIDRSRLHADFGFTLDTHGHPGSMTVKAPGKNQIRLQIEGKPAHAGIAPEKGISAIVAAGTLIADAPQGRIDEETTCNLGIIRGGSATNVVPEKCEIFYETRSRLKEKLDAITKKVIEHFTEGAAKTGCKITAEVLPDYDPYEVSLDSPSVKVASRAAEALGFPVQCKEAGGGSDANHFNEYGISTVVLSVGMTNGHTKEECLEEKDLYDSARWALSIIKEAAKLPKK